MCLAECIASAALGVQVCDADWSRDAFCNEVQMKSSGENHLCNDEADLLDVFRFVIESSKQHFNPNYRLRGLCSFIWSDYNVRLFVVLNQCRSIECSDDSYFVTSWCIQFATKSWRLLQQ